MTDDERVLSRTLLRAREAAFGSGGFVGQESFVSAAEILALARQGGIAQGVDVLDLCCGVAGPGLFIVRELACTYRGVDANPESVAEATRRAREGGLAADFEVARVPPVPRGPFDVVLLLETMLAFRDKGTLLREVCSALRAGGRFAFTVEEGVPLSAEERRAMPGSETVWLITWDHLEDQLARAGLRVRWHAELSSAHRTVADALAEEYARVATQTTTPPAQQIVEDLVVSHLLWSQWLRSGRVRKFAVVAERDHSSAVPPQPEQPC